MRRLTGVEFGILVLSALFIIFGAAMLIQPTEGFVFHQAYRWAKSSVEHVSKDGARVYGVLSILLGVGMVWMVFYGRGKSS
jgi:uncharacterized protein YjeT (DUF2065 family)